MFGLLHSGPLAAAEGRYSGDPAAAILVLDYGSLPTTDMYLRARLQASPIPVRYVDIKAHPPDGNLLAGNGQTFVIICRYVTGGWLHFLERSTHKLCGVAVMIDDDMDAVARDRTVPLRLRRKVTSLYLRHRRRLNRLLSHVWVSTSPLADLCAGDGVSVVGPRYWQPRQSPPSMATTPVVCFYHGTAAHKMEFDWLRPIIERVQAKTTSILFEIVTDPRDRPNYRQLPRTALVHPMGWNAYLAFSTAHERAIGLAPLLPSPVNDARSVAKVLDVTRCGGTGLYSDRAPYRSFVTSGVSGDLLCDDPADWVEAILARAADRNGSLARWHTADALCRSLNNDPLPIPGHANTISQDGDPPG